MDIGQAITALKSNKCIRRSGWNGKNMHLYLEDGSGQERQYAPHIVLYNAQGIHQPGWNASTSDLLATDWEIIQ